MWRLLLVVLVAVTLGIAKCETPSPSRTQRQTNSRQPKCCPCPKSPDTDNLRASAEDPFDDSDALAESSNEDAAPEGSSVSGTVVQPPATKTRGEGSPGCNCGRGGGRDDMTAQGSIIFRSLSRAEECLGSAGPPPPPPPPPAPKPIFRPEVGLASSVLETLRAANEEELKDVRSRAALRSTPPDKLGSILSSAKTLKPAGRTATLTVNKKPLGRFNNLLGSSLTSKPTGLPKLLGASKLADSNFRASAIKALNTSAPTRLRSTMSFSNAIPSPKSIAPTRLGSSLSVPRLTALKPPIAKAPRLGSILPRPRISTAPFIGSTLGSPKFRLPTRTGNFLGSAPNHPGLIKATGSSAVKTAMNKLRDDLKTPVGRRLLSAPPKLAAPTLKHNLLGTVFSKPVIDSVAKAGILSVKMANDMVNSASNMAVKKIEAPVLGSNLKANNMLGEAQTLGRGVPNVDPLNIEGRFLEGLNKVRGIVSALIGKSSQDEIPKHSSKVLKSISHSRNSVASLSKDADDMVSASSNAKSVSITPNSAIYKPKMLESYKAESVIDPTTIKSSNIKPSNLLRFPKITSPPRNVLRSRLSKPAAGFSENHEIKKLPVGTASEDAQNMSTNENTDESLPKEADGVSVQEIADKSKPELLKSDQSMIDPATAKTTAIKPLSKLPTISTLTYRPKNTLLDRLKAISAQRAKPNLAEISKITEGKSTHSTSSNENADDSLLKDSDSIGSDSLKVDTVSRPEIVSTSKPELLKNDRILQSKYLKITTAKPSATKPALSMPKMLKPALTKSIQKSAFAKPAILKQKSSQDKNENLKETELNNFSNDLQNAKENTADSLSKEKNIKNIWNTEDNASKPGIAKSEMLESEKIVQPENVIDPKANAEVPKPSSKLPIIPKLPSLVQMPALKSPLIPKLPSPTKGLLRSKSGTSNLLERPFLKSTLAPKDLQFESLGKTADVCSTESNSPRILAENLESTNDCEKCYSKTTEGPMLKQEKIFNCKMICNK